MKVHVVAAWFEREPDAEAAASELRGRGLVEARVHVRKPGSRDVTDEPILVATVPRNRLVLVRRVVVRHRGRILIDLARDRIRT